MASWYYQLDGTLVGPMASSDLKRHVKAGRIRPETLIRKGDQGKWYPAHKVQGLLPDSTPDDEPKGAIHPASSVKPAKDRTRANLLPCPDCGHLVSLRAVSCPSCGCLLDEPDGEYEFTRSSSGHSTQPSSGGVNFMTAHDVNDDGTPDLFVMHNTQQVGKAIADFREAVGIPDDYTQYRWLKKWGWFLTIACFAIGFFFGKSVAESHGVADPETHGFMLGGICSLGSLFVTIAAQFVD
jgi:GYF domain 2